MLKCSIVIPVYNHSSLTRQCLDAVFHTLPTGFATEIIVVDDHSQDQTHEMLTSYGQGIRIVDHEMNTGFAVACNDGAAAAAGDFLVFLNNDTIPQPGWLDALVRYATGHPRAAVVGAKLLYPDNTVQHAGVAIHSDHYPWHLYAGFPADHPAVNVSRRFLAVTAACALVRREAFMEVAGFDSAFRNGYEDVDLCLRLGKLGYEVHYCHDCEVYHLESMSEGRHAHEEANVHLYASRWAHRVQPDNVHYYLEDDLLRIENATLYPIKFSLSPLLGTLTDDRETEMDQLLQRRAAQVFTLIKENAELRQRIGEGQPDTASASQAQLSEAKLQAFFATRQRLVFPPVDDPLISIIVPLHNAAAATYQALESIQACTHEISYEVILVDDGSTDATPRLLRQIDHAHIHTHLENRGFGEACNEGARVARGTYLCFLNSDTVTTPGWLDALLQVARKDPKCGAVGGKLLYPSGRLQEAGSIIWDDGTTSAYGRNDDPFAPEYSYVREVDYCSAACLLVRRDLFMQIGGFDSRYAPAYYEDADLCLQLNQAGYSVKLAPQAIVFHAEHASTNRTAAIELQMRNRERFVARWAETLLTRGARIRGSEVVWRERRRSTRVLVIDDAVPVAQFGRGLPRTHALLLALVEAGYVITYLPVQDPSPHEPTTTTLQGCGIEVLYDVADPEAAIQERANVYDAAIISRPHHAPLIKAIRAANPSAAIIYDAEAVFALRDIRKAEADGTPFGAQAVEMRIRSELAPIGAADLILAVTEAERRLFRRYHPQIPVAVWGHVAPIRCQMGEVEERTDLLFVGYLGSPPNDDAAYMLISDILPLVRERGDCHLTIVGIDASERVSAAAAATGNAVTLTGYIDDLAPVFNTSRVFVAPHRWAAGIPLKVVEAMSFGVPCVVSSLLAEQLEVTDGTEVLVAAAPEEFAEKIGQLLRDDDLWRRIQRGACAFVRDHYDPAIMHERLAREIEETIARIRIAAGTPGTRSMEVDATLAPSRTGTENGRNGTR